MKNLEWMSPLQLDEESTKKLEVLMDIREIIETMPEQQSWKAFLMAQSKERLVELILDRMVRDTSFSREIYHKLVVDEKSIEDIVSEYEIKIANEMETRIPDVDYLVLLSVKLIERAESSKSLLGQLKLYVSVVLSLDSALNLGAGYENGDEDVLFELIDQCRDNMIIAIKAQHMNLSAKEFGEVYEFLKNQATKYDSVDGDNRIECAFEALKA